ncbi:hypothetical protein PKOR_16835 [Pontibacter korlensis]|uniref:PKD domain-containing protein n=1 Tax=Pontibacter korlensis TaxID=400092 RepID=A0A0E3ZFN1_9BACT|nr:hypothetical protein PKOR_16835 [Pontibacter korlensis]
MKYLFTIWFILLAAASWAQNGCFRPVQDGQEVQVICAGKPVFFRDCTANPDPNAVIFYSPGPGAFDPQNYNPDDLLQAEEQTTFSQPGTYTITQVINREDGGGTRTFAQDFEVKAAAAPEFTSQSCASGAVSFTVINTEYDNYTFDFGDGTTRETDGSTTITHTYTTQGSYTVTLTGSYNGGNCQNTYSQSVSALPLLDEENPTQLEKLTVLEQDASGSVQLELSGLVPGYSYTIEQYTGDFRNPYIEIGTIQNLSSSTITYTVENVNTNAGTWYLVRPVDACGRVFINSNIVSGISLNLQTKEEQVQLNWEYSPDFSAFEVYRNGTLVETLPGSASSYTDNEVTCGQVYSYYIVGTGTDPQGDRYTSVSATMNAVVSSTAIPAAPYLLSSFDLNNQVELTLQLPEGEQVNVIALERSINGSTYQRLTQTQQTTYVDVTTTTLQAVCYRATFTNLCENTSPLSNVSCPIILEAEQQTDGSINLSWSAYSGFPNGVGQYTVELLDQDGNVVASYPTTGRTFTDNTLSNELPVLRYRIRATSQSGTEVTYSNLEEIEQNALVYIPSAFTPNGDGLNDVFEIKGKFYSGYTLLVYNRLGNVIYRGTEADAAWDGTQNGREIPAGAYAYEIVLQTSFGTTKRRTGTITLLR